VYIHIETKTTLEFHEIKHLWKNIEEQFQYRSIMKDLPSNFHERTEQSIAVSAYLPFHTVYIAQGIFFYETNVTYVKISDKLMTP
jgi:hypothetical protein